MELEAQVRTGWVHNGENLGKVRFLASFSGIFTKERSLSSPAMSSKLKKVTIMYLFWLHSDACTEYSCPL